MALSVSVSHISPLIQSEHIRELFNCCGPIVNMRWEPGEAENSCVLSFSDPKHTKAAVMLSGTPLGDSAIEVDELDASAYSQPLLSQPPIPSLPPLPSLPGIAGSPSTAADFVPPPQTESTAQTIASLNAAAAGLLPAADSITQRRLEELIMVSRTVYVGNLAPHIGEQHLRAHFAKYGNVLFVKMAGNPLQAVRYAFLEFDSQEAASRAMALSGPEAVLGDRQLKIGPAMNPIVKPAGPVARSNPAQIEEAMTKVRRAQEALARKKGRDSRSRSRRSRSRSPRSRHRRNRSRSRDRDHRRRRSRSRERYRRRSRSPYRARRSPPRFRRQKPVDTHKGMIWDGFQWNPPAEAALKQSQKAANLGAFSSVSVALPPVSAEQAASTTALVQQAAQQAQLLSMNQYQPS